MIIHTYFNYVPGKPGANRITWEDNGSDKPEDWSEINREFVQEGDLPEGAEIDRSQIINPENQ